MIGVVVWCDRGGGVMVEEEWWCGVMRVVVV